MLRAPPPPLETGSRQDVARGQAEARGLCDALTTCPARGRGPRPHHNTATAVPLRLQDRKALGLFQEREAVSAPGKSSRKAPRSSIAKSVALPCRRFLEAPPDGSILCQAQRLQNTRENEVAVSGPVVQNPGFGKGHGTDDPASPTRKAVSGNAAEKVRALAGRARRNGKAVAPTSTPGHGTGTGMSDGTGGPEDHTCRSWRPFPCHPLLLRLKTCFSW